MRPRLRADVCPTPAGTRMPRRARGPSPPARSVAGRRSAVREAGAGHRHESPGVRRRPQAGHEHTEGRVVSSLAVWLRAEEGMMAVAAGAHNELADSAAIELAVLALRCEAFVDVVMSHQNDVRACGHEGPPQ